MVDIRDLTAAYAAAFDARDLNRVAKFFTDGFELTDPEVTSLTPKTEVLAYIKGLFDANADLSFEVRRILVDHGASVLHFTLTLGENVFDGIDLIDWDGEQMAAMHAYLTPRG